MEKAEIELKRCDRGCRRGMNSKCDILEIKACGCEIHQKSFYSEGRYSPEQEKREFFCKLHSPKKEIILRGDGWCNSCESYCFDDCGSSR